MLENFACIRVKFGRAGAAGGGGRFVPVPGVQGRHDRSTACPLSSSRFVNPIGIPGLDRSFPVHPTSFLQQCTSTVAPREIYSPSLTFRGRNGRNVLRVFYSCTATFTRHQHTHKNTQRESLWRRHLSSHGLFFVPITGKHFTSRPVCLLFPLFPSLS